MPEVLEVISASRLLPVVVIEDAESALALATALKKGGLRCVEITFRTAAAAAALRAMAGDADLTVGAGTVLSCQQVDLALDAGARYIVTPGFSPEVVRHCRERSVPVRRAWISSPVSCFNGTSALRRTSMATSISSSVITAANATGIKSDS